MRESNSHYLARRDYHEANRNIASRNFDESLVRIPIPITRHHNFPSHLPSQPPTPENAPSIPAYQRPQPTPPPAQQSLDWAAGLDRIIGPSSNRGRNLSATQRTGNTVPPVSAYLDQSHPATFVAQEREINQLLERAVAQRRNSFAQAQIQGQTQSQAQVRSASTSRDWVLFDTPNTLDSPRHYSREYFEGSSRTHDSSRHYSREYFEGSSRTPTDHHHSRAPVHGHRPRHPSSSVQASSDRTPIGNDRRTSGQRNSSGHRRSSSQASSRSGEQPLRADYPNPITPRELRGYPQGSSHDPFRPTR